MITGEPIPAESAAGSPLIGATVNGTGSMDHAGRKVGSDTLLAQIVQMVGGGPAIAGAHSAAG